MTKELLESLVDAADQAGVNVEIRDDYSGRGMYGKTTYAVVVPDLMTLAAVGMLACMGEENTRVLSMSREMRKLSSDSMGRDNIVVY